MTLQNMPSLSIVVEWEQTNNSDFHRGLKMLSSIADQLRNLPNPLPTAPELILVRDEDDGNPSLANALAGFPGSVSVVPCENLDYYEQKNLGAQQAKHEAILLVDCDIIPCSGWLQNLLDCYVEERADVVCGATHMESRSIYEKAFAAFWFFPLASEMPPRGTTSLFFANNVLFRAEILKSTPFPNAPLVRGKCLLLAEKLLQDRRSIYLEPSAKVIHPPPNGIAHFVKRALCSGQDNFVMETDRGLLGGFRRFCWQTMVAAKRIVSHRHEVGLGPLGVVGAAGIAASYFTLEFVGEAISVVSPHFIRKKFRV
jgi:glycosyltransferase involved in cell wall biosynthesis